MKLLIVDDEELTRTVISLIRSSGDFRRDITEIHYEITDRRR